MGGSLSRRQIVTGAPLAGLSLLPNLNSAAQSAGLPLRKNIDALTPEELENYKHAVSILIARGLANPSAQDGYAWQAALHNDFERVRPDGSVGACEHRNELFFPWHRAHLAGFEFLLRSSDLPRTANVAIPYWDWTAQASGTRFPKAFEDRTSPLFHNGRYHSVTEQTPPIRWDADDVKINMVKDWDWAEFAGEPLNADGSGGSFGSVEKGPHNTIHGTIGPSMGNPSFAARDPIYWSFHAYIDLIWHRWQRVHIDAANPQPFQNPQAKIWVEPFTPVVRDTARISSMGAGYSYEYEYDFSIDAQPTLVAGGPVARQRELSTVARTGRIATFSSSSVVDRANRRLLRVRDVVVLHDITYALRAYVHPPLVDLQTASADERSRFLAAEATIWMSGGHAHHPTNVNLDITSAAAQFAGREFAISLLIEAQPLTDDVAALAESRVNLNNRLAQGRSLWGSLVLEER